jgi:tripartite-type tricarboxylate transporter receptor subunit TctC
MRLKLRTSGLVLRLSALNRKGGAYMRRLLGLSVVALLAWSSEAGAQHPVFPPQVTLAIGYSPGAAYDIAGRLVSKYLARHLPGAPRIVVQYMPGAGSLNLVNHVYNIAAKDGSFIGLVGRGYGVQPLLDDNGVRYDPLKINWLGSVSSEVSLLWSWHTSPFKSVEDLRREDMIVPGTAAGGDGVMLPRVVNGVLGTKMKLVTGYPGNNDVLLAVERGEGQGAVSSLSSLRSSRPAWFKDKQINSLLQLATKSSLELPGVPLVMDYAANESDRSVLEMIFSRQDMAYPFMAPPGLAPETLKSLRSAFDALAGDPEFKDEARRLSITGEPMSGASIQELLQHIYSTPKTVADRARSIISQ